MPDGLAFPFARSAEREGLFGIDEVFGLYAVENLVFVFLCLPTGQRQVHERVVTAVARRCPGHFALEGRGKLEGAAHQFHNVA